MGKVYEVVERNLPVQRNVLNDRPFRNLIHHDHYKCNSHPDDEAAGVKFNFIQQFS